MQTRSSDENSVPYLSVSAVCQLTLMKSHTRFPMSFPMSLRWSSYVVTKPPKGGSKQQNCRFPPKIALLLKKVCYKVFLRENCQRQSCKAFIGVTIRAKMIGGDVSFYLKFWVKLTALERNRRFSFYFRSLRLSRNSRNEKSSISTNRKSTTHFPISPRWTSYTVSLSPPKGGSKTQRPKFEHHGDWRQTYNVRKILSPS